MKKLTHLGCLLALVFAGASAFADSWFNGFTTTGVIDSTEGRWTVPQEDTKWKPITGGYELNDWDHGAVYTAETARVVSEADSKITTTVTFTAMDPEDLASYSIADAKAGVTLVELAENSYQFKVIQFDSVGNTNRWVDVVCDPTLTAVPAAIPVTVEFIKTDDGAKVKYTIGSYGTAEYALQNASVRIQSVEYRGKCELYPELTGLAWSNKPGESSTVEVKTQSTEYVGPTTIKYKHEDLKDRFAGTELDANNDADVIAYMTTKQSNGQFGWVNCALGQDDDDDVCIQSNAVASTEGKLSFDFGFVVDETNYEVTYKVDDKAAAGSAEVGIESGVHEVVVEVKDKVEGNTYNITNQVVGVMQAESPASENKKAGTKVYEIVAVPWEAFGHTAVTVENLLVTSLLTEGDTLYVWNNEGYYDTYVLTVGVWVAQKHTSFSSQTGAVTKEGTSATDNALAQGTAVWIEHDVASKIVFTGMLKDDSTDSTVTTTVYGGTEDTWTLVANPSIKPFALTGISGAATGDRVVIEDAADPREYECKLISEVKVWGYDKKVKTGTRTIRGQTIDVYSTEWTVAEPIPAGIGFWYVRKAGGDSFDITFGDNNKVVTE